MWISNLDFVCPDLTMTSLKGSPSPRSLLSGDFIIKFPFVILMKLFLLFVASSSLSFVPIGSRYWDNKYYTNTGSQKTNWCQGWPRQRLPVWYILALPWKWRHTETSWGWPEKWFRLCWPSRNQCSRKRANHSL